MAETHAHNLPGGFPPARRQLRLGVVGGAGGFIGPVHALAARMDNRYRVVAGALSSDPARARAAGAEWFLDPDRSYADYRAMVEAEAARADGIDVVTIATPNHTHFPIAEAFLEAGIPVICDKPLTVTLDEAVRLKALVAKTSLGFYVTHAFANFPMVRQAQAMIVSGALGQVRLVHVECMADFLTNLQPGADGSGAGAWRTDPAKSGKGGAVADIGTHVFHLARFVSGLEVSALSARLTSVVPERKLDDNVHAMLRFENGAEGSLLVSQTAPGEPVGMRIRVFGEEGALDWSLPDQDHLRYTEFGKPTQILERAAPGLFPGSLHMARVPRGHPEGYLEAFANFYTEVAVDLEARLDGRTNDFPCLAAGIDDGVIGMSFIDACFRSSEANGAWVDPRAPLNELLASLAAAG